MICIQGELVGFNQNQIMELLNGFWDYKMNGMGGDTGGMRVRRERLRLGLGLLLVGTRDMHEAF